MDDTQRRVELLIREMGDVDFDYRYNMIGLDDYMSIMRSIHENIEQRENPEVQLAYAQFIQERTKGFLEFYSDMTDQDFANFLKNSDELDIIRCVDNMIWSTNFAQKMMPDNTTAELKALGDAFNKVSKQHLIKDKNLIKTYRAVGKSLKL